MMTDNEIPVRVREAWIDAPDSSRRIVETSEVAVDVVEGLEHNRRLSILRLDSGRAQLTLSPEMASLLGFERTAAPEYSDPEDTAPDAAGLESLLIDQGIDFHGADEIFCLSADAEESMGAEVPALSDDEHGPVVRVLTPDDAEVFVRFESTISEDDIDEAFVELDHWEIVGVFVPGEDGLELAAAASAYPWKETRLADVGVLTAPAFRGRGLGTAAVRALSRAILHRGYSPQYRCQGDNHASKGTAASAGFTHIGTWDVIAQE